MAIWVPTVGLRLTQYLVEPGVVDNRQLLDRPRNPRRDTDHVGGKADVLRAYTSVKLMVLEQPGRMTKARIRNKFLDLGPS